MTPTIRVVLEDGRWLRLHMPTVNQQLELDAMPVPETQADGRARIETLIGWLRDACDSKSWEGDVGDGLTLQDLNRLVHRWMSQAQDDAFPFDSESSSETPSAEPPSEEQTAVQSRSRSRRSSKS
ncbi:MAG TPA: hypothetical protein VFJ93_07655 [Gaiellaceae bacterium]|nr:hypothetical protein [Gaiellaceae bacterium]